MSSSVDFLNDIQIWSPSLAFVHILYKNNVHLFVFSVLTCWCSTAFASFCSDRPMCVYSQTQLYKSMLSRSHIHLSLVLTPLLEDLNRQFVIQYFHDAFLKPMALKLCSFKFSICEVWVLSPWDKVRSAEHHISGCMTVARSISCEISKSGLLYDEKLLAGICWHVVREIEANWCCRFCSFVCNDIWRQSCVMLRVPMLTAQTQQTRWTQHV